MSGLEYFRYDVDGPIGTITFDRPEKRNGLDPQVMLEFESLVHRVRDDAGLKILVVTGSGPAFCAGADLTLARDAADEDERRRINEDMGRVPRLIGRVFDTMTHMDVISIAAVNGYAVGGGWSIAMAMAHLINQQCSPISCLCRRAFSFTRVQSTSARRRTFGNSATRTVTMWRMNEPYGSMAVRSKGAATTCTAPISGRTVSSTGAREHLLPRSTN